VLPLVPLGGFFIEEILVYLTRTRFWEEIRLLALTLILKAINI